MNRMHQGAKDRKKEGWASCSPHSFCTPCGHTLILTLIQVCTRYVPVDLTLCHIYSSIRTMSHSPAPLQSSQAGRGCRGRRRRGPIGLGVVVCCDACACVNRLVCVCCCCDEADCVCALSPWLSSGVAACAQQTHNHPHLFLKQHGSKHRPPQDSTQLTQLTLPHSHSCAGPLSLFTSPPPHLFEQHGSKHGS